MKVTLWFVHETDTARRYCKIPSSRRPGRDTYDNPNYIWIPKSVCHHTTKYPANNGDMPMHVVDVADWFAEKKEL